MTDTTPRLSPRRTALALAVVAEVDPKTAAKYLRGEPIRGIVAVRLARGAAGLGLTPPTPKESSPQRGNAASSDANHPGATHGDQPQDRSAA